MIDLKIWKLMDDYGNTKVEKIRNFEKTRGFRSSETMKIGNFEDLQSWKFETKMFFSKLYVW